MISIAGPQLGDREQIRVLSMMEEGQLADGPGVRAFEEEFASYCDVEHGVATSNGTTALHAALHALGIGEDAKILTTPFSFVASANAIRLCGAEPVFADIDPETFTLDPRAAEETIREHDGDIDGMLVVHLFGLPARMDYLCDLAEEYDLTLLEDAAQAHGAEYDRRRVGAFGDAGCFSFYPTKNMTTGEGGMIVTDREDVAEVAGRYVDHGSSGGDRYVDVGHNFRMTSLAAAMGRVQLERLPRFISDRRSNAELLTDLLRDSRVITPSEPARTRHVYNQYTIRCGDRDSLKEHLASQGVDSRVYYPTPIHAQPAYDAYDSTYPVAERMAGEVLSLPIHPGLSRDDIRSIAEPILERQSITS